VFARRRKVDAGWLVSGCGKAQALASKGRFCLAAARQGWGRRFQPSMLAKTAVLAVAPQVGWAGFGGCGGVGWVTDVWRGKGFGDSRQRGSSKR
jgi:hypothetical protein